MKAMPQLNFARQTRGRFRRRLAFHAAALLLWASLPASALAQNASLGIAPAPYYSNAPVTIQVILDGFEEEPQPAVTGPRPNGATLTLRGVTPNVSTTMQIVNGQISTSKTVKFVYSYEFLASKPGRYSVGPFKVTQGNTTRETGAKVLDVRDVPESPHQRIKLVLPERKIYVGERIPVALEWWAESDMAANLFNQRATLPLLNDTQHFRVLDPAVPDPPASMVIDTPAGVREFEANAERRRADGKTWIVRSVPLTVIPLEPGDLNLEPAVLTVDEAIRWRRDFFGQRTATQTRKLRSQDKPRTLVVRPLPTKGQPASFAGAVGSGFSLEVTADRTVVATGDPITLTVTLRGDGTLENASLPPLSQAGLNDADFASPSEPGAGNFNGGFKRFDVTVRVLNPDVREIPPIEYSWFDPKKETYRSTESIPIALSVHEAEVVGADAVERSAPAPDATPSGADDPAEARDAENTPRGIIYTLTGADLAVERSLDRLERDDQPGWLAWLANCLLYLIGLAAVAAGVWVARKRRGDGGAGKRAAALETALRGVDDAITATRLARALRKLGTFDGGDLVGEAHRSEFDSLVRALDEVAYAPGGDEAAAPDDLAKRSRKLAHAIVKEANR